MIITAARLGAEIPEMPNLDDSLSDLTCNAFERQFKDSHDISCLTGEDGDIVSGSFFVGLVEHLGFDSIVLLNADKRFKAMNMQPQTTHIHLMGSRFAAIKSTDNSGAFDVGNSDIHA